MSRPLFCEEEVPGKTQLMAAIVSSQIYKNVTYYEIELQVASAEETRTWSVLRRYSEFSALRRVLKHFEFPCPALPPKQLWWGHTNAFMADRQNALNYWIQAVVLIWQSVAPTKPRVAYAIGELLEAFLCAVDSETFSKILEEVQHEGLMIAEDDEPDSELPPLADASLSETALPISPFVSHVAAADKARSTSWETQQDADKTAVVGTIPKSASVTTFAQVAAQQSRRKSKRASGATAEDQSASFQEGSSLKTRPSFDDKVSRSAPPEPGPAFLSSLQPVQWAPPSKVPSAGAVGYAVNMVSSLSPSSQKQKSEYVTFDNYGQRVKHSFQPCVFHVVFGEGPEGREEVARTSGILDACTPVSVPPTPQAQNQFNAMWNQYTSSVLEFVQERLSIVARNNLQRDFNILDRHYPGGGGGSGGGAGGTNSLSDNEDDDRHDLLGSGTGNKPIIIINLRDKGRMGLKKSENSPTELVEDADAGAGGSAQGGQMPPKHALAASYILAGEHLINTILKEADADISDWQFVSNTKDIVVMRRLRPIKKKNLLKVKGPSIQQPSPSPPIWEDRGRGTGSLVPSALVLDGASSVNSAAAPATLQREPSSTVLDLDLSQHCFMGRGIIDATAEEIFDLVRRPEKRHLYDAMLNEELLLENLAIGEHAHEFESTGMGNLLVYYHLFETNRCFLRYARDFCVMQYAKKVTVGKQTKYVVVGASINHAECPVRDDVERATLDLFGWVVEPTSKPKQCKVTYMMHIDFGRSGVPTHLLNTISFRQPLAVHYVRKIIMARAPEERVGFPTFSSTELDEDSIQREVVKRTSAAAVQN